MAHKAKGSFEQGFNIIGFNESTVGGDIIATYSTPEEWVDGQSGERYVTAPIQIDLTADRKLKDCVDGEKPDGFLYRDVTGAELNVNSFLLNLPKDEAKAGEPVDYVKFVDGAFLQTSLLDDLAPTKGDEVYIKDAMYSSDNTIGSPIGIVVEDGISGQDTDYILIKLS